MQYSKCSLTKVLESWAHLRNYFRQLWIRLFLVQLLQWHMGIFIFVHVGSLASSRSVFLPSFIPNSLHWHSSHWHFSSSCLFLCLHHGLNCNTNLPYHFTLTLFRICLTSFGQLTRSNCALLCWQEVPLQICSQCGPEIYTWYLKCLMLFPQ